MSEVLKFEVHTFAKSGEEIKPVEVTVERLKCIEKGSVINFNESFYNVVNISIPIGNESGHIYLNKVKYEISTNRFVNDLN